MIGENLNDIVAEFDQTVNEEVEKIIEQDVPEILMADSSDDIIDEGDIIFEVTDPNIALVFDGNVEVGILSIPNWIEKYYNVATDVFSSDTGIRCPRATLTGVDPLENMLFTVPHATDTEVDENGNRKKEIRIIYGTKNMIVPDIVPEHLSIYKNNTMYSLHKFDDDTYLKCYSFRAASIITYCHKINDILIPYYTEKIKKKIGDAFRVKFVNKPMIEKIYNEDLLETKDYETIVLLYRQILKADTVFETKQSVLNWFHDKLKDIIDINHLIQIDGVMQFVVDGILEK